MPFELNYFVYIEKHQFKYVQFQTNKAEGFLIWFVRTQYLPVRSDGHAGAILFGVNEAIRKM